MDIWFLFELLTKFLSAYYEKGVLILDRKLIIINYFKSWFILDLLSSFPYSFLYFSRFSNYTLLILSYTRLFRIAKVL